MSEIASAENVVALHGFVIRTHNIEWVLVNISDEPNVSKIVQVHSVTPPGKPQEILYQSENHGDAIRVAKLLQVADDTVTRSQNPREVISAAIGVMNTGIKNGQQPEPETNLEVESEVSE